MIIRTYTPNVQCSSSAASAPAYGTCLNLIGKQMPNDKEVRTFGRAVRDVRQVLPKTIRDSCTPFLPLPRLRKSITDALEDTGGCELVVNTRGPVDLAAWYDIWAATVAIDAICGRQDPNRGGIAPGLGRWIPPICSQ